MDLVQKNQIKKSKLKKTRVSTAKNIRTVYQPGSLQEVLVKNKELRRYVNMVGNFRTGLTTKEFAAGKALVKKLKLPMPPIPKEYQLPLKGLTTGLTSVEPKD